MKFGIFHEHQLPQPWEEDSERRLYQEAFEQVKLADRIGIECVTGRRDRPPARGAA